VLQLSRHHVTAFLDPGRSQFVEQLRRAWDPGIARQIAAHVTLVYPEEIPDAAGLAARTALAAARTPPSTIAVGSPVHAGSPADGVFLRVDDVDGGIRAFRAAAVAAPDAIGFPPHITIVHPRTSRRGGQAVGVGLDDHTVGRLDPLGARRAHKKGEARAQHQRRAVPEHAPQTPRPRSGFFHGCQGLRVGNVIP